MFGNQVEHRRFGIARKIAVIQTQQANHFKRQAAHRHHTAKSDAAAQKTGLAFAVQKAADMADNGFTRQQSVKFGQLRLFLPSRQRLLKLLLGVLVVRIRSKQFLQQIAATLHPAFHIGRLLPLRRHICQSADKFGKTAERVQLVDIAMPRAHALPHTVAAFGQHPAQGQTLYRLLPSKEVVFTLAHGLIQTPMHIQSGNSLMQQRHIFLAQPEALQHQPAFQQR